MIFPFSLRKSKKAATFPGGGSIWRSLAQVLYIHLILNGFNFAAE
jgi:hypothetical protein